MSRIAVVTSGLPFGQGGHLVIVHSLVRALREAGHQAEVVVTPQNRFGRQGAAYLATWLTDVGLAQDGRRIDQVITCRYPAYAVRHGVHTCWLTHRMREYYDLWDSMLPRLTPRQRLKERVRRRLIHAADKALLSRVDRLCVISQTVQQRLQRWGGLSSTVVYPPPAPRAYRCDGYGDYVFAVSRLTPLKRFDLLLRALSRPEAGGARLVLAGEGEARRDLEALVRALGLEHRVRMLGAIDEATLLGHLAGCRAVCFPTRQEDFGFVTVEAFSSSKPVVTCTDSGGAAELVTDGESGFVTAPTPDALGAAIGRLVGDEPLARRLGAAGASRISAITWPGVVEQLVVV